MIVKLVTRGGHFISYAAMLPLKSQCEVLTWNQRCFVSMERADENGAWLYAEAMSAMTITDQPHGTVEGVVEEYEALRLHS